MRLLLVHGAFGGAWAWEPVLPGLRDAGHDAQAIDLPGAGADATPLEQVTLDSYAERICEALAQYDEPPLLVGHSMGGMAITQAAARCPERIAALIYVAAFLPQDGESLLDLTKYPEAAGDQVQANLTLHGDPPLYATMSPEGARHTSQLSTEEQLAWSTARRGPQALAPMAQPFTVGQGNPDAFAALPRAYVTCLRDQAIRPPMQRLMFTRAGCEPVLEIDTDHSPQMTATDELVAALDRIAQALAGEISQRA